MSPCNPSSDDSFVESEFNHDALEGQLHNLRDFQEPDGSPNGDQLPTLSFTNDRSPAQPASPVTLELGEYLASGRVYDVYRAQMKQDKPESISQVATDVVVKFCDPWIVGTPNRFERGSDLEEAIQNARDVIEDVKHEAAVLCRLQHTTIVPRFYSLWIGEYRDEGGYNKLLAMVLEDVGARFSSMLGLCEAGNLVYAPW